MSHVYGAYVDTVPTLYNNLTIKLTSTRTTKQICTTQSARKNQSETLENIMKYQRNY